MIFAPATSLIPLRDENPTRTFSYLTLGLIIINVLVFLTEPGLGVGLSKELAQYFCRFGVVPREIVGIEPSAPLLCSSVPVVGKSVYFALVTSMFLHGGPFHLIGNMLFLWVFGNNIEDTLGRIKFVIFYFAAGIGAGMAHVFTNMSSDIPTVGASGAISGLLGAYIILFPQARITTLVPLGFFLTTMRLPAYVVLGLWFVSQFLIGVGQQLGESGVAWMAHVGGFGAGVVLIFVFGGRRLVKRRSSY